MPKVFISYVSEDRHLVDRLSSDLRSQRIDVWLDRDSILPGHPWKDAIRKAILEGDYFIACFSDAYSERSRTYMNEELLQAIKELRLRPADQGWFIPVLFSGDVPDIEIGPGRSLRDLQYVALIEKDWQDGVDRIVKAILSSQEKPPTEREDLDESRIRHSAFRRALEKMSLIQPEIKKEALNVLERLWEAIQREGPYIDSDQKKRIVAEVFGWPLQSVVRYEYGSPDGDFGGIFFLLKDDREKAMLLDNDFWVQCVLPQRYALSRLDLLDLIGGLPSPGWRVGRP